ncbi:hypothetical protein N0V93_010340 [Gnomoniopsis smithogilvyi]|uniref:Uncharacterized protein n=1 Tax=Gnomoniopsis smithogilvyi TaxID=1191159 RepID=A0A9W8YHN2_9PEZI|nr:hypothetical protein N0V93_010340 [Gnomoniopsis smithogilvyi]
MGAAVTAFAVGDRFASLAPTGSVASAYLDRWSALQESPACMSSALTASIPVAYRTAYYALTIYNDREQMKIKIDHLLHTADRNYARVKSGLAPLINENISNAYVEEPLPPRPIVHPDATVTRARRWKTPSEHAAIQP